MKDFKATDTAVPREDLLDGGDFITEYSAELSKFRNRLTGTEAETACARSIRDRLQRETGSKVRLEAFRAKPHIGRGSFPLLGLWFCFSLILYFVSFVGGRVAGALLTLLALIVFVTGGAVCVSLFLGNKRFAFLFNSKVSYNVVGEFVAKEKEKNKDKEKDKNASKTIVIADNHDAVLGSYFQNFGKARKVAFILAPVTAIIFIIFCVLKMVMGTDSILTIILFSVIPTVDGLIGIFVILTHFSPFENHARQNNGVSTAVSMAVYTYFVEHPDLMPKGAKLVYASFGGENSAHSGSEAFIAEHPEFISASVFCVGDIQSGSLQVAEYDAIRKIAFSTELVSKVRLVARAQNVDCDIVSHRGIKGVLNSLHGYLSNSFAKRRIDTATILAKDYNNSGSELERCDVERLFSLLIGTIARHFVENDKDVKENISSDKDVIKEDTNIKDAASNKDVPDEKSEVKIALVEHPIVDSTFTTESIKKSNKKTQKISKKAPKIERNK